MKNNSILSWLDIGKLICALGILYPHTEPLRQVCPWANCILLCFTHVGVPVFFLLSGFLATDAGKEPEAPMGTGRAMHLVCRVLRLYLVWGVPCAVIYAVWGPGVWQAGEELLFGIGHLWFLTGIMQIAVFLCVWQSFFSCRYLLLISAACFVACTFLSTYTGIVTAGAGPFYWHVMRSGLLYGMIFFLLGRYLRSSKAKGFIQAAPRLLLPAVLLQMAEVLAVVYCHGYDGRYDFFLGQLLLAPVYAACLLAMPVPAWCSAGVSLFMRRLSTLFYCMHGLLVICWWLPGGIYTAMLAARTGIDVNVLAFCIIGTLSLVLSCLAAWGRIFCRRLDWLM